MSLFSAHLLAQDDANRRTASADWWITPGWHEAARLVYDFARLPRIGRITTTVRIEPGAFLSKADVLTTELPPPMPLKR
ncbi:hypothetical protein EVAR_39233_1 [Eumeta japonica]|uniref:Uncharacterized protein n=1 Tax=Eumeta variegata TaxID=151549 RepID=A0A4C1VQ64_EUMVA|nr:hypothetical protein EVAR_39233_1 [Eumeta japonica]